MSLEAADYWECCVSVKCERLKEEPGHESSSACAPEEEAGGQTERGVSAAAARAGLYAGHEIKGELVLGPTALQPPDSAFVPAVAVKNEEHTRLPLAEESGSGPAGGPRPGASRPQLRPPQIHSRGKQHKNGKKLYKCDKRSLVSHERLHTAETLYECATCSAQFARKASLAEHVLGHSGPRAAGPPCALCSARFERRELLLRHAMAHIWTPERPKVSLTDVELIARFSTSRPGTGIDTGAVKKRSPGAGAGFVFHCAGVAKPPIGSPRVGERLRACSVRLERLPPAYSAILSTNVQRQTNQETKPKDVPASELYACDACGEQFARRRSLIRHIPLHSSVLHAQDPTGRVPDIVPDESCSGPTVPFTARRRQSAGSIQKSQGDAGDKPLKCKFCIKRFSGKSNLVRNERIHTGDKPLKCKLCIKRFSGKSNQIRHERIHIGEKPHKCEICLKQFTHKDHLQSHVRIHTGEKPYECNICLKRFTYSFSLNRHKIIHSGKKPHECNICLKQFKHSSSLLAHNRIHTGEKLYECNICLKQFTRRGKLVLHERIHKEEKPHKCEICLKQFTRKDHLQTHVRIHTGEKPYECNICLKRFSHNTSIIIHKRIHTGEKPFKCKICLKQFKGRSNLARHIRIHSGEKPYECNICLKRFSHSDSLIRHKRIHTGEKPFKCKICLKQFTGRSNLARHIRIHSGEKPYKCTICLKQFKHSNSLIEHKRIHTVDKSFK